jgi:hypothetical protein
MPSFKFLGWKLFNVHIAMTCIPWLLSDYWHQLQYCPAVARGKLSCDFDQFWWHCLWKELISITQNQLQWCGWWKPCYSTLLAPLIRVLIGGGLGTWILTWPTTPH